jgi:hypothetical protein
MRSGLTAEPRPQKADSDILEDKTKYISQKKREEINELKDALAKEKQRFH